MLAAAIYGRLNNDVGFLDGYLTKDKRVLDVMADRGYKYLAMSQRPAFQQLLFGAMGASSE